MSASNTFSARFGSRFSSVASMLKLHQIELSAFQVGDDVLLAEAGTLIDWDQLKARRGSGNGNHVQQWTPVLEGRSRDHEDDLLHVLRGNLGVRFPLNRKGLERRLLRTDFRTVSVFSFGVSA